MKKQYITKGCLNVSFDIKIGDEKRTINFQRGTMRPRIILGSYVSFDKDEQKAIESHPLFDVNFELGKIGDKTVKEIMPTTENLEEKHKELLEDNAGKANKIIELEAQLAELQKKESEEPPIVVEEVGNIQQAKEWLVANIEELSLQKLPNTQAVLNRMKDYNVVFPNLSK